MRVRRDRGATVNAPDLLALFLYVFLGRGHARMARVARLALGYGRSRFRPWHGELDYQERQQNRRQTRNRSDDRKLEHLGV